MFLILFLTFYFFLVFDNDVFGISCEILYKRFIVALCTKKVILFGDNFRNKPLNFCFVSTWAIESILSSNVGCQHTWAPIFQLFNWISSHVQLICVFKKWSSYNKVTQSSLFSLSIWNKINDIKNRQLFWFVREQTQRSIIV